MRRLSNVIRQSVRNLPPRRYLLLRELRNKLRFVRLPQIYESDYSGIYICKDKNSAVYFCQLSRASRYFGGIDNKIEDLAIEYMFDLVNFAEGDVLIDCGANIGELGIWAKKRNIEYVAVEPEEKEAECIDRNVFAGERKTVRKALWKSSGSLRFYSCAGSADSSLIEPRFYDGVFDVETTTVAELLRRHNFNQVKLLKLEAEGAEPEILEGAASAINKIEYLAIDCGHERGVSQSSTVGAVFQFCYEQGLEFVDIRGERHVTLFRNPKFPGNKD